MRTLEQGFQGPITPRLAVNVGSRLRIMRHPALRLGFLDAQGGRAFDHDRIMDRIQSETPLSALARLGWNEIGLFSAKEVEKAQFRYEEGRLLVVKYGLKCRSWNHPDYPPKSVVDFALNRPDSEPL